jgi:ariadne-1
MKILQIDCSICFNSFNVKDGAGLECGHIFCKECFVNYLMDAVKEGASCVLKRCPWEKCTDIVSERHYKMYLTPESFRKYKRFQLQAYVDATENILNCTTADCKHFIHLKSGTKNDQKLMNIRCDCGNYFCLCCKKEAHRPLVCKLYGKWKVELSDTNDELNELWKMKNTKKCPKCKTDIEKNQGCMHMNCRKCKFEFCWICLGDWKQHNDKTGGFYACNIYKELPKDNKDQRVIHLEKFEFYKSRYEDHYKAIKTADKKRKGIIKNFDNLVNSQLVTFVDFGFLKEALDLIVESRRAITMTYPVGYYMKWNEISSTLFQHQQSLLWQTLDALDEYTDAYVGEAECYELLSDFETREQSKYNIFKTEIKNKVAGLTQSFNNLLDYIEKGIIQDEEKPKSTDKEEVKEPEPEEKTKPIKKRKPVSKKKGSHLDDTNTWSCTSCTYANANSVRYCAMCETVKPNAKKPKRSSTAAR